MKLVLFLIIRIFKVAVAAVVGTAPVQRLALLGRAKSVFGVATIWLLSFLSNASAANVDDPQIGLLSRAWGEARSHVANARYTYHYTIVDEPTSATDPRDFSELGSPRQGTATIARKDGNLLVLKQGTAVYPDETRDDSLRLVVNNKYVALWHPQAASMDLFDHTSIGQDDDPTKLLIGGALFHDLMAFGYGFGPQEANLEPFVAPTGFSLHVSSGSDPSNKSGIPIDVVFDDKRLTVGHYVIDTEKGYLITQLSVHNTAGVLVHEMKITPKQFGPNGVWVPGLVIDKYVLRHRTTTVTAEVEQFELDPTLPANYFSLSTLDPADGLIVNERRTDKMTDSFILTQGQLIPKSVVRALKREETRIKSIAALKRGSPAMESPNRRRLLVLMVCGGPALLIVGFLVYRRLPQRH